MFSRPHTRLILGALLLSVTLNMPALAQTATPTVPATPQPTAGGQSIGDPFTPTLGNTGYDATHYDLDLRFNFTDGTLTGRATIDAEATFDQLGSLSLDFGPLTARGVTVDGVRAHFVQQADPQKLLITLPAPLAKGSRFQLAVDYSGKPAPVPSPYLGGLETGMNMDLDTRRVYAVNEPDVAHTWFPANDHPRDRATYTFHITVPGDLYAVANGQQEGDPVMNSDGTHTFTWAMPKPMASYLATVEIADYVEGPLANAGSKIPLTIYAFDKSALAAALAYAQTGNILQTEIDLFGAFPFDSYSQVIVDQDALGMESQTMTVMPAKTVAAALNPGAIQYLIAHEMAHHWFGDSIALDTWSDIWLNEGFATYAEYLVQERLSGAEKAIGWLNTWEQRIRAERDSNALIAPKAASMFGNVVYLKGAWVLHMLRQTIGDDAFFKTLKTYTARFTGKSARTEDFFAVAQEVSGQDLSAFVDQWLHQRETPTLSITWTQQSDKVSALVCQKTRTVFRLDLPVVLQTADKAANPRSDPETLKINQIQSSVELTPGFTVDSWQVDPSQHVLADVRVTQADSLPASCATSR